MTATLVTLCHLLAREFGQTPYTFAIALTAWTAGSLLALFLSALLYMNRLTREVLLAISALFGLMPLILLGGTLNFVRQPTVVWGSSDLFPLEWLVLCISALFPALDQAGEEIRRVDGRYHDLILLANLSRWQQFRLLALPHLELRARSEEHTS